jgi:dolichyl-phosphate beta-glucosyltransferase
MQLSIVLPAFNEESRLGETLAKVLEFCKRELEGWEIIVVDDGSTDRTAEIAESFGDVRCLRNAANGGKGLCVRRGMLEASGAAVLFSDVDLSTPIEEALPLLGAIGSGADVAIASRRFDGAKSVERTWLRRLQAWAFRCAVKTIALRGIHDTQCGFKLFRRDVARQVFPLQRLDGWAFDVEVLFIARLLGHRIVEVPVNWREAGGSHLRAWSPLAMLFDLLRIRWYQLRGCYRGRSG